MRNGAFARVILLLMIMIVLMILCVRDAAYRDQE